MEGLGWLGWGVWGMHSWTTTIGFLGLMYIPTGPAIHSDWERRESRKIYCSVLACPCECFREGGQGILLVLLLNSLWDISVLRSSNIVVGCSHTIVYGEFHKLIFGIHDWFFFFEPRHHVYSNSCTARRMIPHALIFFKKNYNSKNFMAASTMAAIRLPMKRFFF